MSADTIAVPAAASGYLIDAQTLLVWLGSTDRGPHPVVLDCSFDLFDSSAGQRAFQAGHVPGARYAHLEHDLSGLKDPRGPVAGGRHPLPDRAVWAERVAGWGIGPDTPVVAMDAQGGPYAARAWWMLRWLGHRDVRVLDGGLTAWTDAGGTLVSGESSSEPAPLESGVWAAAVAAPAGMPTVSADTLQRSLGAVRLVDARALERFRGDVEPLDRQAGHIPGALSRCFKDNLATNGRFKPVDVLQAEWALRLGSPRSGGPVVHQCGSGVTACHNLLAAAVAGFGEGTLYPGSWSEWSADPARPVARGS